MKSLKGHFLVASPLLADDNFYRTVVLMVQHDEDGALGLVLNRPTNNPLKEVWNAVEDESCESDDPVYLGGPVPGPLIAVHRDSNLAESQIMPGLYIATQKEHLSALVHQRKDDVRMFSGYAGWAGGQLEKELSDGGWLSIPADADRVFYDKDDLWDQVVRNIVMDILPPSVRNTPLPDDPTLN